MADQDSRPMLQCAWAAVLLAAISPAVGEVWCVDDDAPGSHGWGWDHAFTHLQDALVWVEPGDTIKIAQGVYYPDRDVDHPGGTGERVASFVIPEGVTILGAYGNSDGGDIDGDGDTDQADLGQFLAAYGAPCP